MLRNLGAPFYTEAKEQQERVKIHHQLVKFTNLGSKEELGNVMDTVTEPFAIPALQSSRHLLVHFIGHVHTGC